MDGFYHIQMMSRLSPFVYWLGTLLFDFTLFAIAMIMRMALFKMIGSMAIIGFHEAFCMYQQQTFAYDLIFVALINADSFRISRLFADSFLLMLTLYGISTLLWIYVLTFLINLRQISMFFFLIINITGMREKKVYQIIP